MAERDLTPKQALFVQEYLIDLNATKAAMRAGYSARTADKIGGQLLAKTGVAAAINAALEDRARRTQITADQVLIRWWDIANADPNELIEWRRACCRYCHGTGYQYQRTANEMERDRRLWEKLLEQATDEKPVGPFDVQGGIGFDPRRLPAPECPECFGEGVGQAFAKDTRHLSVAARRLYAGVKLTRDGLDIKMRDQDAALVNVAKHLGMFVDKVEHSGRVEHVQLEAARMLLRVVGGTEHTS